MKASAAAAGIASLGPFSIWLWDLYTGALAVTEPASLIQGLSSLGFAGLCWYLIVIRDPNISKAQALERTEFMNRIDVRDKAHRESLEAITTKFAERMDKTHDTLVEIEGELEKIRESASS